MTQWELLYLFVFDNAFNLALRCLRHRSSKRRWASRGVLPVHQPPACLRFPSSEVLDCWWQRMALGQGCVCSLPYVYTCTGHSQILSWACPSLTLTHAFIFLLLSVLLFLISCLTDILQPCSYLHIAFTIAFCQSILQKMCIRNVNVFFTFLFLFNTIFIAFFYSLRYL